MPIPVRVPGLGFLDFELPDVEGVVWTSDDSPIDAVPAQTWRAYGPALGLDIGYILFADGTDDDTEPDISALHQDQVPETDDYLRRVLADYYDAHGEHLVRWMGSQFNVGPTMRALVTAYVITDQGKERQVVAARLPLAGRKVVIIGSFDVNQADLLAAPIIQALRSISVLSSH